MIVDHGARLLDLLFVHALVVLLPLLVEDAVELREGSIHFY